MLGEIEGGEGELPKMDSGGSIAGHPLCLRGGKLVPATCSRTGFQGKSLR